MTTDDLSPVDELTEPFEWTTTYRRGEQGLELVVDGTATAPTSGWTAELIRAEPQGINPRALLLHLVVHRPDDYDVRLQKLTPLPASHTESVESEDQYDEVDIDGKKLPV